MNPIYTALRALIMQFTDAQSVIQMAQNRVSKPSRDDFISMFLEHQQRTSTNVDTWDGEAHTMTLTQQTEVRCQIDCYGEQAHDWATRLSTVLRDLAGCDFLKNYQIQPLYASDPFNIPVESDGRNQFAQRWTFEAFLAVPQSFVIALDYVEEVTTTVIEVTTL